jgi:hypothetical protein
MRKPFGRLVEEVAALSDAEMDLSMGVIAERLGVTVERLSDAMDAVKMFYGEPTYMSVHAEPPDRVADGARTDL